MSEAKHSLIPIMTGQYQRLYELESQWGIRLHEGDMRPRIDYFHDAVRALTSGEASPYEKNSRLSIEHLAYDLSQLRRAQSQPLGDKNLLNEASPHTELVALEGGGRARQRGPDRATRAELSELYKDYSVLFAALFAEVADMNFKTRIDEVDTAIEDIALAEDVLKKLANQTITAQQAQAMLEQIDKDELRERLQQAISGKNIRHREAEQLMNGLKGLEGQIEHEKMVIEKAHLNYATSRLAVYEESRETIKRLAAKGMNLAGKFVENALSQSAGRGQGVGF